MVHQLLLSVSLARKLTRLSSVGTADVPGKTNAICLSLFIIHGIISIIRNLITEE